MATVTKSRKSRQLSPVTGTVKVLRPLGEVNDTSAEITINGKDYYLTHLEHGFRLTSYDARTRKVTVYDLPLDLSACDCPDATFHGERPGGCKHQKSLQALKNAAKL